MTVDNELIRLGDSVIRNRSAKLWLPEYVMPEHVNSKIPTEAELFQQSSVQLYPISAQLTMQDGLWRYSKAGAAMAAAGFLKCNYTQIPGKAGNSVGCGFEGAFYAAVAAGALSFKIADTAATKNLYKGARLVIYDDTNVAYQEYTVIGNDASTGVYTVCYIGEPGFAYATTTSSGITIYLNNYLNVRNQADGGGYASCIGAARLSVTSGYFFWLKTAGPTSGLTGASTWPGQTQYQRDVFCNTDGSIITGASGTTELYQRIGYLLGRTASDYGDNLVMLDLDKPVA
jgi:hypothetical protein